MQIYLSMPMYIAYMHIYKYVPISKQQSNVNRQLHVCLQIEIFSGTYLLWKFEKAPNGVDLLRKGLREKWHKKQTQ